MIKAGDFCVYVAPDRTQHNAVVGSMNGDLASLVYVDPAKRDQFTTGFFHDAVVRVLDVRPFDRVERPFHSYCEYGTMAPADLALKQTIESQQDELTFYLGQINDLANFMLGLNCGFPRCDEKHPNGMSAVEAAIEHIGVSMEYINSLGALAKHLKEEKQESDKIMRSLEVQIVDLKGTNEKLQEEVKKVPQPVIHGPGEGIVIGSDGSVHPPEAAEFLRSVAELRKEDNPDATAIISANEDTGVAMCCAEVDERGVQGPAMPVFVREEEVQEKEQ